MPRSYGTTNIMPYASAPPVGAAGDEYYNTTSKIVYVSDGTQWNPLQGGGGGGGGPYVPVQPSPPANPSSPTINPPVGLLWVDSDDNPIWASINFSYNQTLPAPTTASSPYTVTHGLGTRNVQVQLWDSVTGLLVGAQVKVVDANNVQISVTQNMPNNINVVVVGVTGYPAPLNPGDTATKLYVDQRTPNLPPPVTSGSGLQTYTDVLGDVWVAANGVNAGAWKRARDVLHCRYYRAAAISSGVANAWMTLSLDTLVNDDYGLYNASNSLFTPPVVGMWQFILQVGVTATAAAQWSQPGIWDNNNHVLSNSIYHAGAAKAIQGPTLHTRRVTTAGPSVSANDTIMTRLATSVSLALVNSVDSTYFEAHYLGTG